MEVRLPDHPLVPLVPGAPEADPAGIIRDREARDAVGGVPGELRLLQPFHIQRPQALERGLQVVDVHREVMLLAQFLVGVHAVRTDEVDAPAVRGDLPVLDPGVMARELLRVRRVPRGQVIDREPVELLLAGFAGTEHQPLPVPAELEVGDAVLRLRDPACLPAPRAHQVELAPVSPVRDEHEEAAVARPGRRALVVLLGEGHLPRGFDPLLHRNEVDVGLVARLLPVRGRDRVQHPAPVRAHRFRAEGTHLLLIQEGDGTGVLRRRRSRQPETEGKTQREGPRLCESREGDGFGHTISGSHISHPSRGRGVSPVRPGLAGRERRRGATVQQAESADRIPPRCLGRTSIRLGEGA